MSEERFWITIWSLAFLFVVLLFAIGVTAACYSDRRMIAAGYEYRPSTQGGWYKATSAK